VHSTRAVVTALKAVVEKMQEKQGAVGQVASVVKRASQRLSQRTSNMLAAMTLSSTVHVGVAGPVGAGKTSFATTLEIAGSKVVPCLNQGIRDMFDTYLVREESAKHQNDGTALTPYEERVVLAGSEDHELVLCDTPGMRDVGIESDKFAGYLDADQRGELQKKADEWTGRAIPTPDVVFLVFDGYDLSTKDDRGALDILEPYAAFMDKVHKITGPKEAAKATLKTRITSALAGEDVPDIHFVQNYTRDELQGFSEIIKDVSNPRLGQREKLKARDAYEEMIRSCTDRSSHHLGVARLALVAVLKAHE
jgi:hypothetical protein